MPVYNGEKYLKQSLDSVLNQYFADFELILINDGSTDSSINIINSYDDERIRLITQTNSGPVIARRTGIEVAKGEFIAILDADDISTPERLLKQIEFLEKNKEYLLVGSNFKIIDQDNCIRYKSHMPEKYESIRKLIYMGSPFCHSTVVFRKAIFSEFNYDLEIPLAEDYNLWFNILKKYKCANLPDYLVYYRIHNSNVSKVKMESLKISTKSIIEREFQILNFNQSFQTHYDLFWSALNTRYTYKKLTEFNDLIKSLIKVLNIESAEEKQSIQFYFFMRCVYSGNLLSGMFLFLFSGLFNPFYFRYDFFFDNILYSIKRKIAGNVNN